MRRTPRNWPGNMIEHFVQAVVVAAVLLPAAAASHGSSESNVQPAVEVGLPGVAPSPTGSETARCETLTDTDFSNLPDAPTQISSANIVDRVEDLLGGLSATAPKELIVQVRKSLQKFDRYCRVTGYVSPNVGFELLLP